MSIQVTYGEETSQIRAGGHHGVLKDIREAFGISDKYDILLISNGAIVNKVERGMNVDVTLKKISSSSAMSSSSRQSSVVKDINDFMKVRLKVATNPIALFVLKPEDIDGFNDLKLGNRDVDVFLAPKVKKSEISKYFYLREPSFVAFYDGKSSIELPYERDREKMMSLISKCKDPKFYRPSNKQVQLVKETSNKVSSKASSVKSHSSPKSPAMQMLEKYLDEILKRLKDAEAASSRYNLTLSRRPSKVEIYSDQK